MRGGACLHAACTSGNMAIVKSLVQLGKADVHALEDEDGSTPLHAAVAFDNADVAAYLVHEAGASVELGDEAGDTPLHYAARFGSASCIGCLVEAGADTEARNEHGKTALHLADSLATLKGLLEAGADVEARDADGGTLLHRA
ncbi:ankyrin repeat protein, partial [Scenedesmus sp. NREL 46B-D3]